MSFFLGNSRCDKAANPLFSLVFGLRLTPMWYAPPGRACSVPPWRAFSSDRPGWRCRTCSGPAGMHARLGAGARLDENPRPFHRPEVAGAPAARLRSQDRRWTDRTGGGGLRSSSGEPKTPNPNCGGFRGDSQQISITTSIGSRSYRKRENPSRRCI